MMSFLNKLNHLPDLLWKHRICGFYSILFSCFLIALLNLTGFLVWNVFGIAVIVQNNSGNPISEMVLSFTGGDYREEKIESNESRTYLVHPYGECALGMIFKDKKGAQYGKGLSVETGSIGWIYVSIDSENKVHRCNFTVP